MTQGLHSSLVLRMKEPSMESLQDSGWINETDDPLASPSPKKTAVLRPKPASKDYKSDSSISWIWETVDETETENDYEDDESITESPLTQEKVRRKSMEWDMSIINSTGSDDELYIDPSMRSLGKPSSRVDLKEKMNKSSSSLMSMELLSVTEEESKGKKDNMMAKSGFSLATAYVDDDDDEFIGVRFNPIPEVQPYMTRDEYDEEEYFKCFYSNMETNLMLESRNRVIDKINSGKMKNPDTMRGLEYWVEITSTQIDRRVDAMIEKVMDEQDDQIEKGIDDQFKLAELSLSVSIESMAVALKIAMRDARVARKAYRQMFEKEEMDLRTMKSSGTETTAMSTIVLPESLAEKGSKHKRGKDNDDDLDGSNRSNRSSSSRKSGRSTRSTKSKSKGKKSKNKNKDDDGESKGHKKMKKRSSDASKKSSKRKDLKKQSSERSVGSRKSTKKSKKKSKAKQTIIEEDEYVENGEDELEVPPASPSKMKKRRSSESTKKKRRSSSSDIKVKGKKAGKRPSDSEIKVKKRSSDTSDLKDQRRSSAPASMLKLKKRSSSSKHLMTEISEGSIDMKALTSSLSSEEDEHLNRTKEQSKNVNRRSFLDSKAYQQMGTSWLQFLEDTGDDIARNALVED